MMAECEVEWLSPEVIQELLEIKLEPEPSTPGPATNTKSQSMATPQVPITDEEVHLLLNKIGVEKIKSSPCGFQYVQNGCRVCGFS